MRRLLLTMAMTLICAALWGQKADMRRGNRQFRKGEYAAADISYRKALMQDTTSVAAHYNLANNLYRQSSMEEAAKQLDAVKASAPDESFASDYWFNRGDVAIAAQDWKTAVDAFKACLRLTPDDLQAKENFIYARNKLLEQQSQNQQDQDQNQDQNQQNQDQNQQQDQNQDQNQKQQDNQQQQEQQQAVELSPQQAQQLLQAIQEKERQTQDKVDQKKAQAVKSRQKEKNW